MRHLNEGALRRLYDEPLALEDGARAHYNACAECQARFGAIAGDARQAAALLSVPGATVDTEAALSRLKSRPVGAPVRVPVPALGGLGRFGWRKPAAAGLLAAALVATLAFTPLAQSVEKAFEPTSVQPVSIDQSDLQGLDVFKGWADVKQGGNTSLQEAATAEEASKQSGLPVLQLKPGSLPDKFAGAPTSYGTVGQLTGTAVFTDKAPSELHGTTMTVQAGPGQALVYGDVSKAMQAGQQAKTPQDAASAAGPMLAVIEMRGPKVTTSGASETKIKDVLTHQNVSQTVKDAINDFDSPEGNLPLPIPADYAKSQVLPKAVHGQDATFVGDNTGLGAGLIWIDHDTHVVYAVAGLGVDQTMLLAVANGVTTG